jgi:UDP-glucose 4-epimerase
MNFPDSLVLGATGRIGTILRRCWPVGAPILWQTRQIRQEQTLNWACFDPLMDTRARTLAAQGRTAILCLSGVVPGRGNHSHPGTPEALDLNISLAEAAIRAGAQVGARVILASSAAVYGNRSGLLDETTPLRPLSDYGRAKAEMETRANRLGADLGVETCCLRIGNIAGIDSVLGNWRAGFRLDRFADGQTPRRSYIGMQTLARVLGDVMTAPHLPRTLNIAAPGLVGMGALLDAAGLDWTARPAPADAIPQVELDTSALERISPLASRDSQPAEMVAQWRLLGPHPAEKTRME